MKKTLALFILCVAGLAVSTASQATITIPAASAIQSRVADGTTDICYAPCAIYFDGSGVTSTVTTFPYHELRYEWFHGDPGSGNYAYGQQQPRNFSRGPQAAHVYEAPATYTWTLRVFEAGNSIPITRTGTVVVTTWSAADTICIANGAVPSPGVDAGCPAGATAVGGMTSWPAVVSTYLSGIKGTNKKIVLKRGDVFTGAANTNISTVGPAMVGAFGAGAKPKIRTTSTGGTNKIMLASGVLNDVRLVDLDVDGQNDRTRQGFSGTGGAISKLTMLRVDFHDIGTAISIAIDEVSAFPDSVFIVDSSMRNIVGGGGGEGIFASASRFAVIGNHLDNTLLAEHLLRIQNADRAVISHNTFERSPSIKEMMSLRSLCTAPCASAAYRPDLGLTGSAAWTKKVLISNNLFNTSSYTGIHLTPDGEHANKTTENVIIENNLFRNVSGGGSAVSLSRTNKVTVRNNIVNLGTFSSAFNAGGVPDAGASDIFIYNNSIFSSVSGEGVFGLLTDDLLTNVVMRNNVLYAPNSNTGSKVAGGPGGVVSTTVITSNNTTNGAQIVAAPGPLFINSSGSFSAPSDFSIPTTSYAATGGVAVSPKSDFYNCVDVNAARNRIGALVPREWATCAGGKP